MITNTELIQKIDEAADQDSRYCKEGFIFVLAGLEHTISRLTKRRHLTGQELSEGIAVYAREQYGYLASTVLRQWGITSTDDFGEIVYRLIQVGLMSKTDDDRQEDFNGVYDFADEFSWNATKPSQFPDRL